MLAYFLLIFTIVLLLFLLSMIWPPDSPWSPWWRTSQRIALLQCELAKVKKDDVIYDLGSGEGTALIIAARTKGARGVGVEIDPLRMFVSKVLIKLNGVSHKIKIVRKNFFDVDVSDATVIYAYLIPKTLARLKSKFLKELKPGTRVVTFVYKIDLPLVTEDIENEIYVYQIPNPKH